MAISSEFIATKASDVSHPTQAPLSWIVGIGASAGGLNAMAQLLVGIPTDTGMAFVCVQHLDPNHESLLVSLLARHTQMPIQDAIDGLEVLPNHVYIIAPNTNLTLVDGILRVAPRDTGLGAHHSIDIFLQSLALDRPARCIGVILSGTGSDGALGAAAIKATGGITFAQDMAEHDGMPLNAISHSCIDFVLKSDAIAREIVNISHQAMPVCPTRPTVGEDSGLPNDQEAELSDADREPIAAVIEVLHRRLGIDFTHYRPSTIKRRILRRLAMLSHVKIGDYAQFLTMHQGEAETLMKDLLINVTGFFRDASAFMALSTTVFPQLMSQRQASEGLKVWVPGCSTGQEVYSLGIELLEFLKHSSAQPTIQIFASDVSDWALNQARIGWYAENMVGDVPRDRLERYFIKDHAGYRISKAVRDLCVFARHDVTVDTPFSKVDLISCRNLLIYLAPILQMKIFQTFHFALKPQGMLLLGSSEAIGRAADLFTVVDDKHRIFRKNANARRFQAPNTQLRRPGALDMTKQPQPFSPSNSELQRAADRIILGRYAPASVLINGSFEVIQFRGHTHPYLEPGQGEASLGLLTMVPFGVAETIKAAVEEAKIQKIPIRREHVPLRTAESFREIIIETIPVTLPSVKSACFLILFAEQEGREPESVLPVPKPAVRGVELSAEAREILQLRHELKASSDHIQALSEQCNVREDDLRAAREETSSSTEEYRSTNEELQTAKEEVDSTNEELVTLNEELRSSNLMLAKTMELTSAIVDTMRTPLLVLDAEMRVERANQAFLVMFQVAQAETFGRRIYQLGNGQWDIPELRRLLEDILPHNSTFDDYPVTHRFNDIGERTMLLNARRLGDSGDQSRRIVLVIADITEHCRITKALKATSENLMRSNDELDKFAIVASHDLQEPLRMITSYIGLLEVKYPQALDDKGREYFSYVAEGAKRMMAMIKAILVYAQLGHVAPSLVPIESAGPLQDALANLRHRILEVNGTITMGPMPLVLANAEHLVQLFQNLVSNALKFASAKRPIAVHISAQEKDKEWTFAVSDNGIGMEMTHFISIFQLFQRLNDARQYPGTGVGLATCKKIVEYQGGHIWVESEPDVGSTFYFTLRKPTAVATKP